MKKSMRIATMAVAICMVLGAWAVVYAKAETKESGAGAIVTSTTVDGAAATTAAVAETAIFQKADLFSERDLLQVADLSKATTYTVSDSEDITGEYRTQPPIRMSIIWMMIMNTQGAPVPRRAAAKRMPPKMDTMIQRPSTMPI